MGLPLKYLMLAQPVSTQILSTPYQLFAPAAFTDGTAIPASSFVADRQPREHIPTLTGSAEGINCGILVFEPVPAVTAGDNATITIVGKDQGIKRPLREVISVAAGSSISAIRSTKAFAEVTTVTLDGFTTAGNIEIKVDPGVYKHVFTVGNELLPGLTLEMVKGRTPNVYQDVHISEGTFTLGDSNQYDLTLIGGEAFYGENAENGGPARSSTTGKTRQLGRSAPGWATILRINDRKFRIGSGSISINHSLGADENTWDRDVYRQPPLQTSSRIVTLSTQVSFPMTDTAGNEMRIMDIAWGETVSATLSAASMRLGALHNSVLFEIPTGQVTPFPDPADIGQGQINLPLEITAFAEGTEPDIRLTVFNSESGSNFMG